MDLAYDHTHEAVPLREQHLQQLCSCCPVVNELSFALCRDSPVSTLQPLLQLSALTALQVYNVGAAAAAAVVAGAAQLTRLKQLGLQGLPDMTDAGLLQLTALAGLEQLVLEGPSTRFYPSTQYHPEFSKTIKSKVGCGHL
jgi:hypothetical protein